MATFKYTNGGQSTLASGYTAGDSSITVQSGEGARFPSTGDFWIAFDNPPAFYLKCTVRSGDVLTVATTGADGSAAANKSSSTLICEVTVVSALDQFKADVLAAATLTINAGFVGYCWVAGGESTTSTTLGDLTTPDSATFTLAASTLVTIKYFAQCYNSVGGGNSAYDQIYIDGSPVGLLTYDDSNAQFGAFTRTAQYKTTLAAGSHTVAVKHKVNGQTYVWYNRLLLIQVSP